MQRLFSTSALIAPFLIGAALAQDAPVTPEPTDPPATEQLETEQLETDSAPTTDEAATAPAPSETIVQQQAGNELRVDWITGTQVRSHQDENIGSIAELIIDQETNTITAAILSVGGFLGIGAKQIAVRFDELEVDFDAREIHLNLTREEADAAPEYVFRDRTEAPAPPAADDGVAPIQPLD